MAAPKTPAEALSFFESLAPSGVRMGLDRIQLALRALRHPDRTYPSLQVAGTNGKGSTCALAAACLGAQGYKVGLYTSPHLVRVNERFRVEGQEIPDALLGRRILEILERYPEAAAEPRPLTYFEFGTLIALWHFAQEQVDVAVLEVGLGGRLDATTATSPAVTAITPVSFDHMDYLGHTLTAIAREKAGICKPGVPVVVGKQEPEALAAIEEVALGAGAPVKLLGRDFHFEREGGPGPATFTYRGMRTSVTRLRVRLRGEHQLQNAAVALACLELLEDRGILLSQPSARLGFAEAQWPGRLEEVSQKPTVVLDGAHNPAGAEVLAQALKTLYPGKRLHLVFGVLADKDHGPMVRTLFPGFATAHLTPVGSPRTLAPAAYVEQARAMGPEVQVYEGSDMALLGARRAAAEDDVIVCAGSLFLIGELKALLEG